MSEDYDVLSMSETDDYMETDTSSAGQDETVALSEVDSSIVSGSENESATHDQADGDGPRDPVRDASPSGPSTPTSSISSKQSSRSSAKLNFASMDSSQSISMYRLPRLSTESSSTEGRRLPNKHWQLSCLDAEPAASKRSRLIVSVFGFSEELVREVINKLLPNMPAARFLWVHPVSSKKELVASEFVTADKPFDSNPSLPTESDLKSRGEKLIHIFTYDVDADGLEDDTELNSCSVAAGKVWGHCPPSPVVPVTAVFLGTNERNEKARIFASTDAPLLRSPDNVYTPLPIDCLDMLDEDMLLAMSSSGTVARMTTPDKATIPALWPARLMPPSRKGAGRPSYLWMALRFLTLALTLCMLCQGLMKYSPTHPVPGPKDIKVWSAEPEPSVGFFHSLFHPRKVVECDLDPHAVSVAVAQSTSALVEYVKFLYLEFTARLDALRRNVIFYGKEGRVKLDEILASDTVRDLKLHAEELSKLTGRRLREGSVTAKELSKLTGRRLLEGTISAKDRIQTTWVSTADVRKRGSEKVAKYYRGTRGRAANYAKHLWSNAKHTRDRMFADEPEWSQRPSDKKCSLKYRRRHDKRQLVFDCNPN